MKFALGRGWFRIWLLLIAIAFVFTLFQVNTDYENYYKIPKTKFSTKSITPKGGGPYVILSGGKRENGWGAVTLARVPGWALHCGEYLGVSISRMYDTSSLIQTSEFDHKKLSMAISSSEYDRCIKEVRETGKRKFKDKTIENTLIFLSFLALSWLFVWCSVNLYRWVADGFKTE